MNTQFVANEPNAFRADGGLQNPTGLEPSLHRRPDIVGSWVRSTL